MTNPDIAAVAAGLTKASKRALVRIGEDWTLEGGRGPARKDAYSMGWGKDYGHHLVENRLASDRRSFEGWFGKWEWRLTPLGQQVRAFLTINEQAMKEAEHEGR